MSENHEYDDIIYLDAPTSERHMRMPRIERAAQFAPFAALSGYYDVIRETARLTGERIELDGSEISLLNAKMQILKEILMEKVNSLPEISVTYFVPDEKKDGGEYTTIRGRVKRVDDVARLLHFEDKKTVPVSEIISMDGEIFDILGNFDMS